MLVVPLIRPGSPLAQIDATWRDLRLQPVSLEWYRILGWSSSGMINTGLCGTEKGEAVRAIEPDC